MGFFKRTKPNQALVECQNCGAVLNEDPAANPEERKPCPSCGSRARHFRLTVSESVTASASVSARFIVKEPSKLPEMLLQTIVVGDERTTEGNLIQAVAIPWLRIVEILEKDPAAAFTIPFEKWEEIVAGSYTEAGFDKVVLTPRSGDYGRDIIAERKASDRLGALRVIDQVKAYKPGHLVTAEEVRALAGVLYTDLSASKGFITTTSDFAPRLPSDPYIAKLVPSRLELINGESLIKLLAARRKLKN